MMMYDGNRECAWKVLKYSVLNIQKVLGTVVAPTGLGRDVSGSIEIQEFIGGEHRAARWWVDVGHREQREIP